ncbi:hypothetical protein [Bacillus sp. FJAT-29937]|uniref:hypothetical protein n=1 Tax=Bacillus sp. FJAT-29937 TaxID=1720553 RepID=UPI001E5096C3|nr:hypothetical protein [Bacillus sp. FJAT-29937]
MYIIDKIKKRKKTSIAYNNYDIIFRSMTEQFKEKALDFFGVQTAPIILVQPTDLPAIKVNDRRMDFMFLLADDTYLHLEFQTTFKEADLDRFLQYDVSAYELFKKQIQTVVIYGADVEEALENKNYGSVKYDTQAVFMKDYDGDQIMQDLWSKVESGQELTEMDELNLIFSPLMNSSVSRSERAIETVELAKKIKDEEKQVRLMATIIAISDKFIDKEYVEKLMEVLSMARVLREFEKRVKLESGIAGSQHTIKDYLDARFGIEAKRLQDQVDEIVDLELLNKLIHDLFRAENRKEMEWLIEAANEKQKQINKKVE